MGGTKSLSADQRALVERNVRLAHWAAMARAGHGGFGYWDLYSAACEGLCRAALSYDPGHGLAFSTYAAWRMRSAIADFIRKEVRRGFRAERGVSLARPVSFGTPGDGEADAGEPPSGDLPVGWELEYQDEVAGLCRRELGDTVAARAITTAYAQALCGGSVKAAAEHLGLKAATAHAQVYNHRRALEAASTRAGSSDASPSATTGCNGDGG